MSTRTFANVSDDGLLFSGITATETRVGTTNSVLFTTASTPTNLIPEVAALPVTNTPLAVVAGLAWRGFVGGATGPGSTLSVTIEYDVSSTVAGRGISAIRGNSVVPDSLVPAGARLELTQQIFDADGAQIGRSQLVRTSATNDPQDPPFEAGDIQLGAVYDTVRVKVTVSVTIAANAAPTASMSFSGMTQSYNTEVPASLGDFVFEDSNGNGIRDAGEGGIGGVAVELLNTAGTVVARTQTDQHGFYDFGSLLPGAYSVRFVTPQGYEATRPNQGSDDAVDSDAVNGVTAQVTLAPGDNVTTLDAGFLRRGSIGDTVFEDRNGNGIREAGEGGIGGVTVQLLGAGGAVLGEATTDGNGGYLFGNLLPGDYAVRFVTPAGFEATAANQGGDDALDSDAVGGVTDTITLASGDNVTTLDAGFKQRPNPGPDPATPGLDIEKTTSGTGNANPIQADWNNEDLATGAGVPILAPGGAVTWTYRLANTGNTTFTADEIRLVDDNGTPGNAADDMSLANGRITFAGVESGNADNLLAPGEVWLYRATGTAQNLTTPGTSATFDFSGSSALSGAPGNVRDFTAGGISAKASAFSRDEASGAWSTAFLGAFGGGLGVTDGSEGNGSGDSHTIDNIGRDNYVVIRFDREVVVDSAFLGYVVDDSDISVWIGNVAGAFAGGLALTDRVLADLGFNEVNTTTSSSARLADINAGNRAGNVLVIAADTTDTTPEDRFKLEKVTVQTLGSQGVYANTATVSAQGVSDTDLSHYRNPQPAQAPRVDIEKLVSVDGGKTFQDADAATGPILGECVTPIFRFTVRNTGDVALSGVTVTDDRLDLNGSSAGTARSLGTLGVGHSTSFDVTGGWQAGQHTNLATVTATGAGRTVTDSDAANYFGADGGIRVVKVTNGSDGPHILSGSAVTWTYTVTNTGNIALGNVHLTDDKEGRITTYVGDTDRDGLLDVNETWTFTEQGTAIAGHYSNQATVEASYADGAGRIFHVCDDDGSSYRGVAPRVEIEKLVSVDGGCTFFDADTGTGPQLTHGTSPVFRFVVTNTGDARLANLVVSDDRLDLNGSAAGTTRAISSLDAGKSFTFDVTGSWQSGQHTNLATVTATFADAFGNSRTVTDSDAANFLGVAAITGPGVRTPGFWQNNSWRDFWDGDQGAPKQAGTKGFASGDVLFGTYGSRGPLDPVTHSNTVGLLIGDFNRNGRTDAGEKTIFYTVPEALSILQASDNSGGQDARAILDRGLVATWLNFLAGNPLTDPGNSAAVFDARDAVNHAVDWLRRYTPDENGDSFGDGSLTLRASSFRVPSSNSAWNNTVAGIPAGNTIKNWLDEYNNSGTITQAGVTTRIAWDGDLM